MAKNEVRARAPVKMADRWWRMMSPLSVGLSSLNREGSYETRGEVGSQRKDGPMDLGGEAANAVRCNPSRYPSPSTIRQVLPRRLLGSRTPRRHFGRGAG